MIPAFALNTSGKEEAVAAAPESRGRYNELKNSFINEVKEQLGERPQ
jgi:hypothetical protein